MANASSLTLMPKSFLARSSSFSSPPPPKTASSARTNDYYVLSTSFTHSFTVPRAANFRRRRRKRVVVVLKAFILLLEGFCGIIAPKLVFVAFVLRIKVNILCVLEFSSCAIRVYLFGEFYPLFLKKNQAKWRKVLLVVYSLKKNRSRIDRPKLRGRSASESERILCARVVRLKLLKLSIGNNKKNKCIIIKIIITHQHQH